MRVYVLAGIAAAVIALVAAGCGEGPVFHEDRRVLAETEKPTEKESAVDTSGIDEEMLKADPELRKKLEQEEKQEEEAEKEQEGIDKAIKSSTDAIDTIGLLIHDRKFDEAIEVFDANQALIRQTAEEGMADSNPKVSKLYREWWDTLLKMRNILEQEDLDPETKEREAKSALSAAGDCKRSARQMGIYEQ